VVGVRQPVNHAADEVLQNVDQGVTDLAGRRERADMVSVGPNSPAATERPIRCFRNTNREALDPASQRKMSFRFDDQVNVVALDTVVNQAEAFTR